MVTVTVTTTTTTRTMMMMMMMTEGRALDLMAPGNPGMISGLVSGCHSHRQLWVNNWSRIATVRIGLKQIRTSLCFIS